MKQNLYTAGCWNCWKIYSTLCLFFCKSNQTKRAETQQVQGNDMLCRLLETDVLTCTVLARGPSVSQLQEFLLNHALLAMYHINGVIWHKNWQFGFEFVTLRILNPQLLVQRIRLCTRFVCDLDHRKSTPSQFRRFHIWPNHRHPHQEIPWVVPVSVAQQESLTLTFCVQPSRENTSTLDLNLC